MRYGVALAWSSLAMRHSGIVRQLDYGGAVVCVFGFDQHVNYGGAVVWLLGDVWAG